MLKSWKFEPKIYLEHTEQIITFYNRLHAIGVNLQAVRECAFTDKDLSELTEKLESIVSSSIADKQDASKRKTGE